MKKTVKTRIFAGGLGLLALALLLMVPSCGKKSTTTSSTIVPKVIVEQLRPLDEALLPLLDGFTSGAIAKGEPIVVRFKGAEVMKVKYGETLPAKAFSFKPSLKGNAVWIDETTVGFQYDDIDPNQNYTCDFRISDFVDAGDGQPLQFGFAVRRQNFSLVGAYPVCAEGDKMDYTLRVAFVNPVDGEVEQIIDANTRKAYTVTSKPVGGNVYDIVIQGIARKNNETVLKVTLDGTAIEANKSRTCELPVYAKDDFKPVEFDVDNTTGQAVLYFTQPLKQGQNLNGFLNFNYKIGYRSDIQDNKIVLYFDKTSLYRYQMEDLEMTVASGIRSGFDQLLQEEYEYQFDLTDYVPQVRWTDDGVIIPNVDETTVYFDAICLNSVTLRIIRVFDDNILSFLQDNELDETYGVRKAGRLEKKIRLQIDNPYPTQWKTFPIVLSDYIKVEPGAMYQLSLDFGPADYRHRRRLPQPRPRRPLPPHHPQRERERHPRHPLGQPAHPRERFPDRLLPIRERNR